MIPALSNATALTALNPAEWNAETTATVNARLETASAAHIADWAVATFGKNLGVASSMQDTILQHLFGERLPGVDVLPELTVGEQDAKYGKDLFKRDPNLCCAMRKVDPLAKALSGYDAWVTGARRVDAVTRSEMPVVSWDAKHGLVKINPLALWDDEDVESYQVAHDLPRHPLVSQGYPSIGCAPCTRKVAPGEDPRAGRWAGHGKTECGIHT